MGALTLTFWIENKKADRGEKELESDEVSCCFFNVAEIVCVQKLTFRPVGWFPTRIPLYLLNVVLVVSQTGADVYFTNVRVMP